MSPRKKSKHNPKASAEEGSTDVNAPSANTEVEDTTSNKSVVDAELATSSSSDDPALPADAQQPPPLNKKASRKWLGSGASWRSKAPADVKTAQPSICVGVAGGAASELPDEDTKNDRERSPAKFLTKRKSSKGDAIPTSITRLHVSSDGSLDETQEMKPAPVEEPAVPTLPTIEEPPLPPEPPKLEQSTFGWRSWWSRPDGYPDVAKAKHTDEASSTPLPGPTPSEEADAKSKELGNTELLASAAQEQDTEVEDAPQTNETQGGDAEIKDPSTTATTATAEAAKPALTTSWFWLWSSAQNAQTNPGPAEPSVAEHPATDTSSVTEAAVEPIAEEPIPAPQVVQALPPNQDAKTELDTPKSARQPVGWAFWFRDKPKTDDQPEEGTSQKQVGEIAVSNTPSQSHPEAAQFNEQEQAREEQARDEQAKGESPQESVKPALEPKESIAKRSFRSLRGRPKSTSTLSDSPSTSKAATPLESTPSQSPVRPETLPVVPAAQPDPKVQKKTKSEPPNLVLPEFKTTYRLVQQPSFWQQVRQYFLGEESPMPHLHINPAPPRIKKAVAIGVHGFFPAPIIQKVLGQPTGTSIRFASAARNAIEDWARAHGYSPEIEQIALEGEGFIADRVNTLWKLLLNWVDHIKSADFILVACHSQGVPVAMMLVAKLIQFGCVNGARIGVCAMAGINQGPFKEYKTRYLGGTASELFEFSDPKSLVSQMYLAALDEVLKYGVRILYVGSIDDQLVPLEVSEHGSECIG
jgi:hypothetical protein